MTRGHGVWVRRLTATAIFGIGVLCVGGAAVALATSNSDPNNASTKQDQRWAKSIVLRIRDLPTGVTWHAYGAGVTGSGGTGDPTCPGTPKPSSKFRDTAQAGSPLFLTTNRQFVIASAAWIYKTSAEAKSFVHWLEASFVHCGSAELKSIAGTTKSLRLLSSGVHPIPATHHWWNYRIVVQVHAEGKNFKSYVDLGFGVVGRATAWLTLHGAYEPLPASVEADLVRVVQVRMAKPPH